SKRESQELRGPARPEDHAQDPQIARPGHDVRPVPHACYPARAASHTGAATVCAVRLQSGFIQLVRVIRVAEVDHQMQRWPGQHGEERVGRQALAVPQACDVGVEGRGREAVGNPHMSKPPSYVTGVGSMRDTPYLWTNSTTRPSDPQGDLDAAWAS